jgi:hypothetical protein
MRIVDWEEFFYVPAAVLHLPTALITHLFEFANFHHSFHCFLVDDQF